MLTVKKGKNNILFFLVVLVVALMALNQWQMMTVSGLISESSFSSASKGTKLNVKLTGNYVQDAIKAVIATGTPAYGQELGVSFDDPVNSINVLNKLDSQISVSSLTADEKARYVNIGSRIACEFCCGATAIIDKNGNAACGCAHSGSFRGLAKYLIKNHPNEWTDDQILLEMTKWKALYFPKNMVEKASAALENGLELTPAVLNDRDLLKKIKGGDTASIGNLPSQVGNC